MAAPERVFASNVSYHPVLVIARKDGRDHLIGFNGTIVASYDSIFSFSNGLAMVQAGTGEQSRFGLIDEEGNELVSPIFKIMEWDSGNALKDGLIPAKDAETGLWG